MVKRIQKFGEYISISCYCEKKKINLNFSFLGDKEKIYKQIYDSKGQEKHHLII